MLYSFDDAAAAERHETQYFEVFVNRGIYHKGWTAVTRHSTPWGEQQQLPALDDDVWELYTPQDWTQARKVAAEHPERLRDLQRLFLLEAAKCNVFPLDDRRYERFNSDLAGRPAGEGQHADAVRRVGPTVGEQRDQHQEQIARHHRRSHRPASGRRA